MHTELEAIAGAVRQLSTAAVNPDELMTVGQVAESMKVAATTVRMWIHSGQLRAIKPGVGPKGQGRTYRVSRADLKEFVASGDRMPARTVPEMAEAEGESQGSPAHQGTGQARLP